MNDGFTKRFPARRLSDEGHRESSFTKRPARLILASFLGIILLGTVLLQLPQATTTHDLAFVDALFMATSAACVTGLVTKDIRSDFTLFGQLVVLALIQLGGLGIMTFSTFFIYLLSGRLSLTGRDIVQGTFSQHPMADLTHLLRLVLVGTIAIELFGALLLSIRFMFQYSPLRAFYLGSFHAVSAFCNAGFALFPGSFVSYRSDVFVNLVLGFLIIAGGLGFVVLFDLYRNSRLRPHRFFDSLQFHTRVTILATVGLLLFGLLSFLGLESRHALVGMPFSEKLVTAFFQSVTTRTAGFNTVDLSTCADATLFIMIILMFIGAAPGSCGGGIKATTFVVIMASVFARFRMQEGANLLYRQLPENVVSRAISVVFLSGLMVILFTIVFLIVENVHAQGLGESDRFMSYFFEVVSAFGTVGLSTGITPQLTKTGKVLITVLMFVGRLGPLTIALAVRSRRAEKKFRYVKENVVVG